MNLPSAIFPAPLDPTFQPAILFNRNYVAAAKKTGRAVPLVIGLERENKLLSRYETVVLPEADATTQLYVERLVKFLLWAWGGGKLYVGGPKAIGEAIRKAYSPRGARKFDYDMMTLAYAKPFEVVVTTAEKVPATKEAKTAAGGHLKGCRIGFDLGASDYKFSAVIDGTAVYTDEVPWDPKTQSNPEYHYHHIVSGLHRAAAYLPRVDAIGGSSAGIIVDNEIRVASLLRAIPKKDFQKVAKVFKRIQREWNVPVQVMNDGDVTALAGALSLGSRGMLGIAMGSSQAAGFMDRQGRILGWLNELAFVPVDLQPNAAVDEWSQDKGTGVMYFSQQAVNKLLPAAKIKMPEKLGLPERLKEVQNLMAKGDARTVKIYETIGIYLGCALAQYTDFYDYEQALILGRVTTGKGGDIVIAKAEEVLKNHFPEVSRKIEIRVPDEKSRRVGQAVAAASLPSLKK
ncbi:MAG TPA: ROK family protein [Verrucomicrobiae bacterium]|nr:ROK family protein [Verrucomicrobiae bacterium]